MTDELSESVMNELKKYNTENPLYDDFTNDVTRFYLSDTAVPNHYWEKEVPDFFIRNQGVIKQQQINRRRLFTFFLCKYGIEEHSIAVLLSVQVAAIQKDINSELFSILKDEFDKQNEENNDEQNEENNDDQDIEESNKADLALALLAVHEDYVGSLFKDVDDTYENIIKFCKKTNKEVHNSVIAINWDIERLPIGDKSKMVEIRNKYDVITDMNDQLLKVLELEGEN